MMSKHALTLVNDAAISAPSALLPKLQAAAIRQVSLIRRTESEASQRAVLLGLTLHRIRVTMKGEFTKWLQNDFEALGYRQARYYMSAASTFIAKTKVTLPEFLALPGDQTELALDAMPDAKARALMTKIEKFVRGRALGELFEDLGIKESKKKRLRRRDEADDTEEPESKEVARIVTVQDRFNEIEAHLVAARKGASDKALWIAFSKQQHADLRASAHVTASVLDDLYTKTHGRAKA